MLFDAATPPGSDLSDYREEQVKATWSAILTDFYPAAGHSSDPICHSLSVSFFVTGVTI